MKPIRLAALLASAIVAVVSPAVHAEEPQLADLLAKGAAYVRVFVDRFSNVVTEERYTQERLSAGPRRRELVSDYFLINLPGSNDWLELRDVIQVDGKPVGDRENRLLTLVKDGTPKNWAARARSVARDSARFNVEDVGTINRPLIAISFLQAPLQRLFAFTYGPLDKKVAADARLIRFKEARSPAMFRVGPVYGNIWLSETTGAVLKTELQFGNNRDGTNHVVTMFAPDADLGVNVPVEMEDAYAFQQAGGITATIAPGMSFGVVEVKGRATYGHFRRFGVKAEEEFKQ